MKLNINTPEIQIIVKDWFNINKNNKEKTVSKSRIFELNKTDIRNNENLESNSNNDEFENKDEIMG